MEVQTGYHKNGILNSLTEDDIKNDKLNKKYYNDKEIDQIMKETKENNNDEAGEVYIGKHEMYNLVRFTLDLINSDEIGLAKRVFDIANDLHYFGRSYSYNYDLVDFSIRKNVDVLEVIINFMGESEFTSAFEEILVNEIPDSLNRFVENIATLEKYDLLINLLHLYVNINIDDQPKVKMVNKILPNIKKAIQSDNKALVLKYVKFLNI